MFTATRFGGKEKREKILIVFCFVFCFLSFCFLFYFDDKVRWKGEEGKAAEEAIVPALDEENSVCTFRLKVQFFFLQGNL